MTLIHSLSPVYLTGFVILIIWFYGKKVHKHETLVYVLTSVLSLGLSILSVLHLLNVIELEPSIFYTWIFRGHLAFALYIPLMVAGVLKPKTKLKIKFMQVRRELAIIGAILLVPHAVLLIGRALSAFNPTGTIAFFIIIPLVITSFPKIRRTFSRESWLGFHKWAYIVYAMIYIHIASIHLIAQRNGTSAYDQGWLIRFVIITLIFAGYLIFRFNEVKNVIKKSP